LLFNHGNTLTQLYERERGFFLSIAAPGTIVSRPAFATTTAMYGKNTAPARANQRKGLGRITVKIKHAVRTIMEIK
jgi:hypothetical protein